MEPPPPATGFTQRSISVLVSKVKEARVQLIIEKLTVMTSAKDDALRDVASLGVFLTFTRYIIANLRIRVLSPLIGLKTVVKEIAPESKLAVTACNKLAPKILEQLKGVSNV